MRSLVRETRLDPAQFILPLFVCPGRRRAARDRLHAGQLPDVGRRAGAASARRCNRSGIGGVILFGLPETKDEMASGAYADDGIVQRAMRAIKQRNRRTCWS